MVMSNLIPFDYQNQRVLTSSQLAEAYETDTANISNNFNRNKDRYTEGKHFFLIEGDTLKKFKLTTHQNDESSIRVNKLYLWTEKGAWLHAKSLNTDRAWEAYETLVDDYYRVMDEIKGVAKVQSQTWDRIAIGEVKFAKEFAKAAGIRPERAIVVALARIEKETGKLLGDYRKTLPAVEEEDAELLTPSQIGEQIGLKASQVNLILEEIGLQFGIREAGEKAGTMRLIKRNPWRLTEEGREYGIMQDSAKQSSGAKWEGFQILWSPKTVEAFRDYMKDKKTREVN